RVGGEDLLVHQRVQPAALLLLSAVGGEHLHVAGVRRGRAEDHWRGAVAAQDLVEQSELELAEPGAAEVLVEEQRPEAVVLDLLLERVSERPGLRVARVSGAGEHQVERLDLIAAELLDPVELLLEFRLRREVPRHSVPPRLVACSAYRAY